MSIRATLPWRPFSPVGHAHGYFYQRALHEHPPQADVQRHSDRPSHSSSFSSISTARRLALVRVRTAVVQDRIAQVTLAYVAWQFAQARMRAGVSVTSYAIAVTSVRTVDAMARAPTRTNVARMKACIDAAPYSAASSRQHSLASSEWLPLCHGAR